MTDLSKIQTIELTREQLSTTIKDPSNYYIVNAFGNRVYQDNRQGLRLKRRLMRCMGKGFYKVRTVSDKDDLGKKQWSKPEEYKPVRGVHTKRGQRKPN